MRVKIMLALLACFGVLAADTAFAGGAGGTEGLAGPEWRVVEIRYEDGKMRETLPNTDVSATFSDNGNMSGSAGCNRYFAAYSVSGKSIKIGPAGATRKMCAWPQGIMDQEAAFLSALESVAGFRVYGERAALLDSRGEVVLVLADAEAWELSQRLTGTWRVEKLDGRKLLPGTEITMTFTENGRVAGKGTINNYFASWIESDGLILFTNAGLTMMAGPEGHMGQESVFIRMLGKIRKYKVDGDILTLTDGEKELITARRAAAK